MSWIARLGNLLHSARHGRDLDRELDFHLAEKTDDLVARGMPRRDAEREARLRFGHRQGLKEETRDAGVLGWLESLTQDLRYAARGLKANPGFTLTVVLSLGLGIGANTAIFSLINAVLLKSLPVERPSELVQLTMGKDHSEEFTNPLWEEIRKTQDVFSGVFAFGSAGFNLAQGGEARRVDGSYIGGDFFPALGLAPAAGRLLTGADDYRGCPATVVLGHGFWQAEYAGARDVIGRTIALDGHPFEIVGVAPAGFFGAEVGRNVQLYAPLCAEAVIQGTNSSLDQRANWWLSIMGRPRPGLRPAQIDARLAGQSAGIFATTAPADWDAENLKFYLSSVLGTQRAETGLSEFRPTYRAALFMLMAVVVMVLLIACGNVANLLLARGAVRQREVAMRLALGASRGRLVRQMLTESLLLSLLGAATGFLLARWGSQLLVRMLTGVRGGVWLDLSLDYRVLGFTAIVAIVTGVLFGLLPAWRATRVDPQVAIRAHGHGVIRGGSSRFTLGKALVLGQVALSLVLVLGAALLLTTFHTLATLDPGFRRDGLLAVRMDLRASGAADARRLAVQREVLDRMRLIPGVESAAAVDILPVSGMGWNGGIEVAGRLVPEDFRDRVSWFNRISTGFFTTMGTRFIAGRDFGSTDAVGSVPVAIITEAMAKKFFPPGSPVGRRFTAQMGPGKTEFEVVGVVADSRYRSLKEEPAPIVYLPDRQTSEPSPTVTYLLRSDLPPGSLMPQVRAAVAEVDPRASFTAMTVSDNLARSLVRERLLATLSGFFGGLAILLALIGLYGIMAYSVARRRNEIGIRLALGAERIRVLRMVLGEVVRLVSMGVGLGVIASLGAGRLVTAFLYGVSASDPQVIAVTATGIVLVGLGAGAVPAWRAARLDPVAALRED